MLRAINTARLAVVGLAVVGACATTGCASAAPSAAAPEVSTVSTAQPVGAPAPPVLGRPDRPRTRGLGTVRPSVIDLGGDANGIVEKITWSSWGGPTAEGIGITDRVAPGAPNSSATEERATIVASDLGDCGGHPAYRAFGTYFPQHGETRPTDVVPVCDD